VSVFFKGDLVVAKKVPLRFWKIAPYLGCELDIKAKAPCGYPAIARRSSHALDYDPVRALYRVKDDVRGNAYLQCDCFFSFKV
jgi:hypothetical protein